MDDLRLVFLETSGNQSYIFATNKLRDMIGASQLLYEVGTNFVSDAAQEVFKRRIDPEKLTQEPSVSDDDSNGVEAIVATSGKSMLLVRDSEMARAFVSKWSRRVLESAPGVDATGVISSLPVDLNLGTNESKDGFFNIVQAMSDVHKAHEKARVFRRSPQARFARLPVTAPCLYSGYPAGRQWDKPSKYHGEEISDITYAKWEKLSASRKRISAWLGLPEEQFSDEWKKEDEKTPGGKMPFVNYLHQIEVELDKNWLAVIHADGNGLGQIFIDLPEQMEKEAGGKTGKALARVFIETYRNFSVELDRVASQAIGEATCQTFPEPHSEKPLPLLPIVVGGDDLTVAIDGEQGIVFAKAYIKAFVQATERSEIIRTRALAAGIGSHLGLCAGISITKPHFPFFTSFELAEELLKSAKMVKRKLGVSKSALDFHILYDSSAHSIEAIRDGLKISDMQLTGKPYVVFVESTDGWGKEHDIRNLENAAKALSADEGALPNSQAHQVRQAMFSQTKDTQEAEWKILLEKYDGFAKEWKKMTGDLELYRLFENGKNGTYFLDALEAKHFLRQADDTAAKGATDE